MNKTNQNSTTWSLYMRLARYAVRYRAHLITGILAGMICGGTVFGMLQMGRQMLAIGDMNSMLTPALAIPAKQVSQDKVVEQAGLKAGEATTGAQTPPWMKEAQRWADRFGVPLTKADGRMTWQCIVLALVLAPIIVALRLASLYANQYSLRWVGSRVVCDLRDEMFENLQEQSLKYHGSMDVGHLISRCTADIGVVDSIIFTTVSNFSRAPFEIAGSVVFVVLFAREHHMLDMLALLVIGYPACIVPVVLLGRRIRSWTVRSLDRVSVLISRMHENLTCIRIVKAFHMEKIETVRFREDNRRFFKTIMRAVRIEMLMSPLTEAMGIVLGCVFLVLCFSKGMKVYEIGLVGMAAVMAYKPVKQLTGIVPTLERGSAALGRVFEMLDLNDRLPEHPNPVPKSAFQDRIAFEDVSFQYHKHGKPVVCHASFAIPRGHVVAVVGATGSGKTTLANLLARFYDPTDGRVCMDGTDLRDICIADLRKLVGIVTQETVLFNVSIAENITYGSEGATQAQIEEAAKMANAHDFIMGHRDGYARMVGEKGFVLSGGERQRVAIARAILRNPPILILDEATSALDTVTERQVQEAIARVMKNRTIFAIAHRLSTIRQANMILVVEKGVIVERGTHDELYAQNGVYKRLCDMQFMESTDRTPMAAES